MIFEKMVKIWISKKMIFPKIFAKFLLKNVKKQKKSKKKFRDGPAHWRARRPSFNSRMRLAGVVFFFLLTRPEHQILLSPKSAAIRRNPLSEIDKCYARKI